MEWIKLMPGYLEPYKNEDRYMVLIYGFSDIALQCSFDLIYWDEGNKEWSNSEYYPTWTDRELYEYYTHFMVIEAPKP